MTGPKLSTKRSSSYGSEFWPRGNVTARLSGRKWIRIAHKHKPTERDKGMSSLAESNQTAIKKSSG